MAISVPTPIIARVSAFLNPADKYPWALDFMVLTTIFPIGFIAYYGENLSLPSQNLETRDTFSLTFVGALLPFIFAAVTYAKSKLAETVSEMIVESVLTPRERRIWCYLFLQLCISAAIPFFNIGHAEKSGLQISIVFFCSITALFFIASTLHVAKFANIIPLYTLNETKSLERLFEKESRNTIKRYRQIIREPLCGRLSQVPPSFEEITRARTECVLSLVRRNVALDNLHETQIALLALENMVKTYYTCRKDVWASGSDDFTVYLTAELKKLLLECSNVRSEKFLDSFRSHIKEMAGAACAMNPNMHHTNPVLFPWEEICVDLSMGTADLRNTNFPLSMINTLGFIGVEAIRRNHVLAVEHGTIDSISRLIESYSGKGHWWPELLRSQAILNLIKLLPTYVEHRMRNPGQEDYLAQKLMGTIAAAAQLCCSDYKRRHAFRDALDPFLEVQINFDSLIAQYSTSCSLLSNTDLKSRKDLPEHINELQLDLLDAHDVFNAILDIKLSENIAWEKVGLALTSMFFVDVHTRNSKYAVSEEWLEKASLIYRTHFEAIAGIYESGNRNKLPSVCSSDLLGIPAIILTFWNHDDQFAHEILNEYCNMIIRIGEKSKLTSTREFNRVCQYIKLFAAWLFMTETAPHLRLKLEVLLDEHFKLQKQVQNKSELVQHLSNHYSAFWHLSPTVIWDTQLQDTIGRKLGNAQMICEYLKDLADRNLEPD